jgi:hypothetical protein
MRKENSQMPGALIMRFAGRDQHMQVRECCSMCREAKSSFSAWQRTIFSQWTLPATLN